MAINKQDSNATGLAFAEEESQKVLPVSPVWFELEPNTYSDFGGDIEMVSRAPINRGRQRKRGTVTGLTAGGGFNQDFTQNNFTRLMQGFFFADAREKPATLPLNGAQIVITAVDDDPDTFAAASGLDIFQVGHIVLAENFTNEANNGIAVLSVAAAGLLTTTKALTAEASPPANASLRAVGYQFASGDLTLTSSGGKLLLGATAKDLTELGLTPGEWIFIGGDSAGLQFASNTPGFARVETIAEDEIVCDRTTFTPVTTDGSGKTVQIFFGTVLRNEDSPSLIVRRTYNLERSLGEDDNGEQAEYLAGSVPNEMTFNIPSEDKLNIDVTFVGMDVEYRDGTEGLKSGTRIPSPGEEAFNTSSDVYQMKIYVNATAVSPEALFGFASEGTITVGNGIKPNKAIGVMGAFDTSAGDFEVGGSVTAYFSEIAALQAVRGNADVAFNVIMAQRNAGAVFDIPLLTFGGGRPDVKKDEPIMLPLEATGAENEAGYTLMYCSLHYLPTVAMP